MALVLGSCDGVSPTPAPPVSGSSTAGASVPGPALRVGGVGLAREDVDRMAARIAGLYPEYEPVQCRRLALVNAFLPQLAVAGARAEARASARGSIDRASEALRAGAPPTALGEGLLPAHVEGPFAELGLELWSSCLAAEVGVWVGPFERTGRFTLLRVERRWDEARGPRAVQHELSTVDALYLEPGSTAADVQSIIDASTLEILDPELAEAVPESWKYRMRVRTP
jgi:hypothetical protein